MSQDKRMTFNPITGLLGVAPDNAQVFRVVTKDLPWSYNPWNGWTRDARDMASDPTGILIHQDEDPLMSALKEAPRPVPHCSVPEVTSTSTEFPESL